jgi:hypothetical protein
MNSYQIFIKLSHKSHALLTVTCQFLLSQISLLAQISPQKTRKRKKTKLVHWVESDLVASFDTLLISKNCKKKLYVKQNI